MCNVVTRLFQDKKYKYVEVVPLEFHGGAKHIEITGLRNLIDTVIREIEKAKGKGNTVVINATAGFKVLVIYSTMLGMIYNVPVKYIHEDFQSVVSTQSESVYGPEEAFSLRIHCSNHT